MALPSSSSSFLPAGVLAVGPGAVAGAARGGLPGRAVQALP